MSTQRKLSRAERKAVQAAISRAKRTDKKEMSAQDSIPYLQIRVDGICQVTPTHFTKTIQFRDINYQLSDNEDKQAIFDGWCDFLNYFDSSIKFQFSFVNLTALRESFVRAIPLRSDQFESIQRELSKIIEEQQAKGNNGIVKTKYLTFGIDADNIRSAKPRLERIETDILNNFKRLGVSAEVLNGQERLRVLHDILRMDTPEPFAFRWEDLPRSGLSTKDYIAPSSFLFSRAKDFRMGKKFASVSFLQILAPELSDRILKDFLDIESNIVVNIHVQSVDQVSAIKTIKRTITDLDKSKIEEQKKAVRAGYDMDIIPSDLATYGAEAKKLLMESGRFAPPEELEQRNDSNAGIDSEIAEEVPEIPTSDPAPVSEEKEPAVWAYKAHVDRILTDNSLTDERESEKDGR